MKIEVKSNRDFQGEDGTVSRRGYIAAAVIQGLLSMHANLNVSTVNVDEVVKNTVLIADQLALELKKSELEKEGQS